MTPLSYKLSALCIQLRDGKIKKIFFRDPAEDSNQHPLLIIDLVTEGACTKFEVSIVSLKSGLVEHSFRYDAICQVVTHSMLTVDRRRRMDQEQGALLLGYDWFDS